MIIFKKVKKTMFQEVETKFDEIQISFLLFLKKIIFPRVCFMVIIQFFIYSCSYFLSCMYFDVLLMYYCLLYSKLCILLKI